MSLLYGGEHPPQVKEKENYSIIMTQNTFFIYDKVQKKITKAYGIDIEKTFVPGYRGSLVCPEERDELFITAERPYENFSEYHYVYNVEKDSFERVEGEPDYNTISKRSFDEAFCVQYDVDCMSSDLNTVYYISRFNGQKIYPFRNDFNKEDFVKK